MFLVKLKGNSSWDKGMNDSNIASATYIRKNEENKGKSAESEMGIWSVYDSK